MRLGSVFHVPANQGVFIPTAGLPFEGYHFHACALATNGANYALSGYTVKKVANYLGQCTTTTNAIYVTFDHAISQGQHTLNIANVTNQTSQPLSPSAADFVGPDVPARFYVWSASGLAGAVQVQFDDLVDATSGGHAANYATTPSVTLTDGLVTNETSTLGGTTVANQVYRLDVTNVLLAGTTNATTIPPAAMWGFQSFYPTNVFSLSSHALTIYFSEAVGASAATAANYTFSGGITATNAQATTGGVLAKLTLAGDSRGQTYTVTISTSVESQANVPVATVYGGILDVAFDAAAYTGKLPILRLAGEDLSIDRAPFFSQDGTHLYVDTGVLATGSYTVSMCGLQDAPRTSTLHTDVKFTIP